MALAVVSAQGGFVSELRATEFSTWLLLSQCVPSAETGILKPTTVALFLFVLTVLFCMSH